MDKPKTYFRKKKDVKFQYDTTIIRIELKGYCSELTIGVTYGGIS